MREALLFAYLPNVPPSSTDLTMNSAVRTHWALSMITDIHILIVSSEIFNQYNFAVDKSVHSVQHSYKLIAGLSESIDNWQVLIAVIRVI